MSRISHKVLLVMTLLAVTGTGFHPRIAAAQASQQDKAKACNDTANRRGLTGEDRKNFMQTCLNKVAGNQSSEISQKDKINTCKNLADKRNLREAIASRTSKTVCIELTRNKAGTMSHALLHLERLQHVLMLLSLHHFF